MSRRPLDHAPPAYRTDIRIDMGEWEKSSSQYMETSGLGPCVGLALFDPVARNGYMAHTCGAEIYTLLELLDEAAKDITRIAAVKAWVSGGELDPEGTNEADAFYPAIREDVLALLAEFGIRPSNLEVAWVNGPNRAGNIFLDPETGKGGVVIEEIWEDGAEQDSFL